MGNGVQLKTPHQRVSILTGGAGCGGDGGGDFAGGDVEGD